MARMVALGPNGQPIAPAPAPIAPAPAPIAPAPAPIAPAPAPIAPAPAPIAPAPAASITWHRTRGGVWCVVGPAAIIRPGATVEVATKAGKIQAVAIAEVGREFDRDGVPTVYGYRARTAATE